MMVRERYPERVPLQRVAKGKLSAVNDQGLKSSAPSVKPDSIWDCQDRPRTKTGKI